MTDQIPTQIQPPAWAESKAREQVVSEWSRVLGEVRPDGADPGDTACRVELLQYEEVQLTEDPPSVLRFPPNIWINGARYPLDQALALAELIAQGVELAGQEQPTT